MNIPYVKNYDQNGVLTNPIVVSYLNQGENRQQRRAVKNQPRFMSNKKGICLTVGKNYRYERYVQVITHKKGELLLKPIRRQHYFLKK